MIKAYSYLRFSSPAQAEGDSIRRQEALRSNWLKRHPEVVLDTSLKLIDKGVSGFQGKHRKVGALSEFLDHVERKGIAPGSYLIVESLDRLTREEFEQAVPLVLSLLTAGIRVVALSPIEAVYEPGMDESRKLMMVLELSRGHRESQRKSDLLGEAWGEKKREARDKGKPHGKQVPAWIELEDGKYRLKADSAKAVRRIFKLSVEGMGTKYIAKELNKASVPPIGRGAKWTQTYVAKILRSRAAIGEYQPMRKLKNMAKREPEGEPIADYFPAVVSEAQWHAAQKAIESRKSRSGRPSKRQINVFSGLVWCALDQCRMNGVMRYDKQRHLISSRAFKGEEGSRWCTFPLEPFTEAILSELRELKTSELFTDPGADRVTELEGQLGEVERRLTKAQQQFDADPESIWADMVSKYDKERRALVKELAKAKQEAANPNSSSWAEFLKERDPLRIRAALLRTVESIYCVIVKRPKDRGCVVQIRFQGSDQVRTYVINWQQGRGGAVPSQAGKCESHTWVSTPSYDLRVLADAKLVEFLQASRR